MAAQAANQFNKPNCQFKKPNAEHQPNQSNPLSLSASPNTTLTVTILPRTNSSVTQFTQTLRRLNPNQNANSKRNDHTP